MKGLNVHNYVLSTKKGISAFFCLIKGINNTDDKRIVN